MIEVHLLRYALAAADSGSFSRAADQFRIKQSTLSKGIRFLELRVGVPLFTRSTQGVAPTPSGMKFLARARSIVGDLDLLSNECLALSRGDLGKLRLGFHGTLAAGDLGATLEAYRRDHAGIDFEATEGEREQLLGSLDHGHLDIAVVAGEAMHAQRRSLSLWSEPLVLGFPVPHPLLDLDRLYWTDLRGMSFLVTRSDPGSLIAAMVRARLAGADHAPRIVTQSVSSDNLHSLAMPDLLPVTAGPRTAREGIAFREIHDAFGATRLEHSLHWRDDNTNPALASFLALATRRYGRSLA